MRLSASLAIVFGVTTATMGQTVSLSGDPHPAVVRIIAPERSAISYGSGSLVAVQGAHGLVVTNWHVVRDATGQIVVVFPDGFRSGATVLATDRDWDLAALAIWRPNAEPIPLSTETPRPGEPLTIAGYGSGRFRTITGRCTQYVSPGSDQPFEMVELSAAARQGDSGGPILNSRGELAGVLFGAAFGTTTGSYCGRVRRFLATVTDQFQQVSPAETMIAARPEASPPPAGYTWQRPPAATSDAAESTAPLSAPPTVAIPARRKPAAEPQSVPLDGWTAAQPHSGGGQKTAEDNRPIIAEAPTRLDQIKTFLAIVGAVAILFHGLRFLSVAHGS